MRKAIYIAFVFGMVACVDGKEGGKSAKVAATCNKNASTASGNEASTTSDPKKTALTDSSGLALTASERSEVCHALSNYSCSLRVFKPGVQSGDSLQQECVSVDDFSDSCLDVKVKSFDTEVARENADPAQFEPGGSYNYHEYHCFNEKLSVASGLVAQGEGQSLAEALRLSLAACSGENR